MKTRIITGLAGLAFCIIVFTFGEYLTWLYSISVAVINAIMCFEFMTAKRVHKQIPLLVLSMLFGLSMPLLVGTPVWYLPIIFYTFLMFLCLIFFSSKITVNGLVFAYAGSMILTLSMSTLAYLMTCMGGWHAFYATISLIGSWSADTVAYFTGTYFGKHKLCPNISPKKTVEGAVGGGLASVVFCVLCAVIFQFVVYKDINMNYPAVLVIGLYCSVVSVLGDLIFSAIKRECSIKDYGSIMPGHGGFVDRFDSVIFCVPFVFLIANTWGLFSII